MAGKRSGYCLMKGDSYWAGKGVWSENVADAKLTKTMSSAKRMKSQNARHYEGMEKAEVVGIGNPQKPVAKKRRNTKPRSHKKDASYWEAVFNRERRAYEAAKKAMYEANIKLIEAQLREME